MGCVVSGTIDASENTNKVEPVPPPTPLKTDKVTRAFAQEQRKSALSKHHSNAIHKAKTLSDKVLAEKETLSCYSVARTVRSSWSQSTAPTQVDSVISQSTQNDRKSAVHKPDGAPKTAHVHFDTPVIIRSDSGHFSDIPEVADDRDTRNYVVAIKNNKNAKHKIKRVPTPKPFDQETKGTSNDEINISSGTMNREHADQSDQKTNNEGFMNEVNDDSNTRVNDDSATVDDNAGNTSTKSSSERHELQKDTTTADVNDGDNQLSTDAKHDIGSDESNHEPSHKVDVGSEAYEKDHDHSTSTTQHSDSDEPGLKQSDGDDVNNVTSQESSEHPDATMEVKSEAAA